MYFSWPPERARFLIAARSGEVSFLSLLLPAEAPASGGYAGAGSRAFAGLKRTNEIFPKAMDSNVSAVREVVPDIAKH